MTEVEILNDMLFCSNLDCEECSRKGSDKCVHNLIKDARAIMKMQSGILESRREEIENLTEHNRNLQNMVTKDYTEESLIKAVNNIIEYSYDACDCGDYVGNLVWAMQDFIKLTKLDAVVAFGANSNYPQIYKK